MYFKNIAEPRVFIRFTFSKCYIVNQYNVNISYLILKKWFTENQKYFETKYDAKLIFFFVIILIYIFYTISNKYLLSKNYYTYNNKDTVKLSSSLDNY